MNPQLTFAQQRLCYSRGHDLEDFVQREAIVDWALRDEARPLLKAEKSKVKFTKALRTAMSYDVIKGVQGLLP